MNDYQLLLWSQVLRAEEGLHAITVQFRARGDREAQRKGRRIKALLLTSEPEFFAPQQESRELRRIVEGSRTVALFE